MPIPYLYKLLRGREETWRKSCRGRWTREEWKNWKRGISRLLWRWRTSLRSRHHSRSNFPNLKSPRKTFKTWSAITLPPQWILSCCPTMVRLLWVWHLTTSFYFQPESICPWTIKTCSVKMKTTTKRAEHMTMRMTIKLMELRGSTIWRSWSNRRKWASTSHWGPLIESYPKREWKLHYLTSGRRAHQCRARR